jgi:intracellular sulfur oxidation DsrE/DsrF family protein
MAQDKVVYHFDNSDTQATPGLRTLRNYMDTAPNTKIIAVAVGDGVNFLMDGAKDKKNPNIEYGPLISDLVAKGVKFEVCELTLRAMDLKKDQFVMDATFTPSGVVRIGQLQGQGYGYIKP